MSHQWPRDTREHSSTAAAFSVVGCPMRSIVGSIPRPAWQTKPTLASMSDNGEDMSDLSIVAYRSAYRDEVLALTLAVWTPIFAKTKNEVPRFVYDAFYPRGWQARQTSDVASLLDDEPENIWLAIQDGELAGFIGLRMHPDDQMGEVHIIAVAPDRQRQGIGRALLDFAERQSRRAGMKMIMVETVDDTGHEPARRAYEATGYERWPVARYFKPV